MRIRLMLVTLTVLVFGVSAEARCFQCDQTTGYYCFMAQGSKGGCDSPSDAGCVTWGTCTPRSPGPGDGPCTSSALDCDPFEYMRNTPMSNELEVAAVSVKPARSKSAATHAPA
jgi:hypothetical protein